VAFADFRDACLSGVPPPAAVFETDGDEKA